jgi:hypothetical protein
MTNEVKAPVSLIELAIDKGAGIEHLKGLMELQERWEANQARKRFKEAMVDFQREKPELKKDQAVKFNNTNYQFNSLPNIQRVIDPVLSQHGLSYRWEQEEVESKIRITCIVSHLDGHEERTHLTAPTDTSGSKNPIQSIGSTVSYLKRYTLEGALGLSSDKDTDAVTKTLPELTAKHERWAEAVKHVKSKGAAGLESIKTRYTMTESTEVELKKAAGL